MRAPSLGARRSFGREMTVSDGETKSGREGNLQAPTRHALGWQEPAIL